MGSDAAPGKSVSGLVREVEGGGLWIATTDMGAFRWDGAVRVFTAKDGLPHTEVRSFCVSPSGDVIVETSRGAAQISGDRVSPYPLPEGSSSPSSR